MLAAQDIGLASHPALLTIQSLVEDYEADDIGDVATTGGCGSSIIGVREDVWRCTSPVTDPLERGFVLELPLEVVRAHENGECWASPRLSYCSSTAEHKRSMLQHISSTNLRCQEIRPPLELIRSYYERRCGDAIAKNVYDPCVQALTERLDLWLSVEHNRNTFLVIGGRWSDRDREGRRVCDLEFMWGQQGGAKFLAAMLICEHSVIYQSHAWPRLFVTSRVHKYLYERAGYRHVFDYVLIRNPLQPNGLGSTERLVKR